MTKVTTIAGALAAGVLCITSSFAATDGDQAAVLEAVAQLYGVSQDQAIDRLAREAEAMRIEAPLKDFLGEAYAGSWIDNESGQLVVATKDPANAKWIKVAGARPVQVSRSLSDLGHMKRSIISHLDLHPGVSSAIRALSINYQDNAINVYASPEHVNRVRSILRINGWEEGDVRVVEQEAVGELLVSTVRGANAFTNTDENRNCSLGFSLVEGGYTTAGHCGWYSHAVSGFNGTAQGSFVDSTWPPYAGTQQEDFA